MEDIVQTIENNKKQFEFLFEGITHAIDDSAFSTIIDDNNKTTTSSSGISTSTKAKVSARPRQRKTSSSGVGKSDENQIEESTATTAAPQKKRVRKSVTIISPKPISAPSTTAVAVSDITAPIEGEENEAELINNTSNALSAPEETESTLTE